MYYQSVAGDRNSWYARVHSCLSGLILDSLDLLDFKFSTVETINNDCHIVERKKLCKNQ